jgi:hypothetical protein
MKKPTLSRIVSLALVAVIPPAFANTPLVETAFEADEGISSGPLPESGPGWNTNGDYPFQISIDENDPDLGQIAVSSTETLGKGSRLWINRLDSANQTIVEIDLKASRSGHPGYQANLHLGRFAGEPPSGAEDMAVLVSLRGSGKIHIYNGSEDVEAGEFRDGEWHCIRIEADPESKTFSAWVDDQPLATDFSFYNPDVDEIRAFGVTHYCGEEVSRTSAMAIDNLKIYTP